MKLFGECKRTSGTKHSDYMLVLVLCWKPYIYDRQNFSSGRSPFGNPAPTAPVPKFEMLEPPLSYRTRETSPLNGQPAWVASVFGPLPSNFCYDFVGLDVQLRRKLNLLLASGYGAEDFGFKGGREWVKKENLCNSSGANNDEGGNLEERRKGKGFHIHPAFTWFCPIFHIFSRGCA